MHFRHSPELAPDSAAVRERLLGSSVLQEVMDRRGGKKEERDECSSYRLTGVAALCWASDSVRTDTATEEHGLKAEVAAG